MPDCGDPVRPEELAGLFARAGSATPARCVLAVSGGSDSTALMVLFADFLRLQGWPVEPHAVVTVDHGLRPESAAEAQAVAAQASALGFPHATLAWQGAKPHTGIQEAARTARYRLIGDFMRARGFDLLLTAHTLDDQAETVLMRLARGSGLDGLAAMAPSVEIGDCEPPVRLVRPLLDIPKARLQATLRERGIGWIEDPGNQSLAFERVRLRAAREQLEALGLTSAALALSARRLQRARHQLDAIVEERCRQADGAIHVDPAGFLRLDRAKLEAGEEVFLRILGRCIAAAGGSDEPVPLAKLETIAGRLRPLAAEPATGKWTLARALITATRHCILVEREPDRAALPSLSLAAGQTALWDGRFHIEVAATFEGDVEVRALGRHGLAELRRLGRPAPPARPLRSVPSFWRAAELVAAPAVDYWARPALRAQLSAAFAAFERFSGNWSGPRYAGEPESP